MVCPSCGAQMRGSFDELPADLRPKVEAAQREALQGGGRGTITVTDASGTTRTYESVDQMPPGIRAIYERARRDMKP